MNRKCASGTGSFLDEMALRLDVPINALSDLASRSTEELELGSYCTVFSATELLSAISNGKRPADLARAVYRSLVQRVLSMGDIGSPVVVTGGVVEHHPVVVELLRQELGMPVHCPPHAQIMGALGAALAARASVMEPS
jgi:activator of 2-hydroxyglutaryl-CoA dehydratase